MEQSSIWLLVHASLAQLISLEFSTDNVLAAVLEPNLSTEGVLAVLNALEVEFSTQPLASANANPNIIGMLH